MPTELEELVEFLHHGNTQIRQVATEHLVGYSATHTSLFKREQLTPVKDLKLLVKDYPPIAKHALTMLINLSGRDSEVLGELVREEEGKKDGFLGMLVGREGVCGFPFTPPNTCLIQNCDVGANADNDGGYR